METRKKLLAVAAGLILALLVLRGRSLRRASWEQAARDGARQGRDGAHAGGAASGAIPGAGAPLARGADGSRVPEGLELAEALAAAGTASGEAIDCSRQDCSQAAAAAAAALAAAREQLRLIAIKEREKGEARRYGRDGGRGLLSPPPARYSMPDEAAIAAAMESFLDRLKRGGESSQAPGGTSGGAGGPGEDASSSGGGSAGASDPIISRGKASEELGSPTLKMLEKLNSDTAHSVSMSRDPGLEDGSKDKAGNKFDGAGGLRGTIPVEEYSGAFGKKAIRRNSDD